jgi:hypothetical protein
VIREEICPFTINSFTKEQKRLEKAVIKLAIVPAGPPDEKTGKVKKAKPLIKFDL